MAEYLNIWTQTQRVNGCLKDHRTGCWIEWTNITVNYMDRSVVRSDWFHYCINYSVDSNYYFNY